MGCGQSSISDQVIITPYKLEAKTSRNLTEEFKQDRQTQVQTTRTQSSKLRHQMKDRLSDQEIQAAYDKSQSKIPELFDSLSERISSYYMDLSVQTIQLLSYQRISQVETKIYLSQQFLLLFLDIMRVIGKKINYQFQISTFKNFNDSQSSLINYIKQKYPRAGAVFVPGDLMQTFKTFSMVQNPENDILRRAGISFMNPTNKQIIKNLKQFFNCLIDQIDSKFPIFQNLLTQRVFSYESDGKKKLFNYKIGRKLPQSISKYDITQNDELSINSPELFRMIIKWVTDIQQFFTSSEDEINEKQTFKVCEVKDEQVYFDEITPDQYLSLKQDLKTKLKQTNPIYKKQIQNLMQEMHMFNANLLRILFTTERKQKYVPQSQAQVIKYAMFNTKLVSWMMAQKLITVLKNLIKIGGEFEQTQISRRLDLIKFNVKDLLRAMVIGNKKQILTVYQNLKKLEAEGALKIIQIKNRLGTPLNDAMVIFTIKQSFLICQLQLVLSQGQGASQKLKSIQLLNHFLYELVRSPYGVLSEVAVLLGYKDTKINYEDKISFENKSFSDFVPCVQKHPESVIVEKVQSKPFICSQCTQFYQQFDNIFGYKKCEKCFIYQCCKCMFKKNKDYQQNQVNQRFIQALSCQFSDQKTRKSNFDSLSKDLTINQVLTMFHDKKIFLKNMFPKKNYQKIQTKDLHGYIKDAIGQKNDNLSFITYGQVPYFLLVQFKGQSVYMKPLFWNQKVQQIQNPFDKYDNFYESKVSSSFYDFIIFLNTAKKQQLRSNQIQKDIKICIKPDIPYHSVNKFTTIKYITKTKFFVFIIGIQVGHKAQDIQNNQQQNNNKKQFKFSSIADARKSLPTIGIVLQNFQMKNQGITTPLLDAYFKTYAQKSKIRTLNLSNNKIVDISVILKECVNVEQLILAKNYIKQIKIQTPLPKLQKLIVFDNRITNITGFMNAKELQKINIQDNRIQKLEVLNLTKLNEITISSNDFQSLDWLQKSILPELQYLVAYYSGIKHEYENDKNYTFTLPKVKKINYSGNPTKFLKLQCPELKFLQCSQCSLKKLQYSSLKIEQLNIQANQLQNFSNILSEKTQMIKKIQGSNAGTLPILPKIVAENLQSLLLSSCGIENLDNLQHSKMPKLSQLDINYSLITSLPPLNFLNLKSIVLYGIRFKSLSELANSNLPLIQDLQITGDAEVRIQQLPTLRFDSLKNLRLESLNLGKTEAFMKSDLPCLQKLDISQIKIQKFAKMTFNKLTSLTLTYTSITDYGQFNESVLPQLTSLSFTSNNEGNPLADEQGNFRKINCPKLTDIYIYYCKDINVSQLLSCQFPCLNSIFINSSYFISIPVLKFPQLTTINFGVNELQNIEAFGQSQLPKIETIELVNNKIKKLPRLNLPSLKKLALDYNQLQQLHRIDCSKIYSSYLENSISISKIAIKNQSIRTDISKLPALTELSLMHNKLSNFPVLNLQNLQIINIADNPLKSLTGLGKSRLINLQSIQISNCLELQQKNLPQVDLPKVNSIRITQCNIVSLDKLVKSNLNSLKTLYLESLQVVSLPVLKLPQLETFAYNGQSYYGQEKVATLANIENMSKWQCPKLVSICLRKTKFQLIPVLNFPKLVKLELTGNQNLKFAHNIKLSNLPELDEIYLNDNPLLERFEMVSDCLVKEVNLSASAVTNDKDIISSFQATNLYLFNNEITNLAALDLSKTQYLNADTNKIQQFSPCFQKAYKLNYLSLSSNNIKQIPDLIFPELSTLVLSNNQLAVVNIKQKNFPVLDSLNLQNNKIVSIQQISAQTLTSINLSSNSIKSIQCFNKNPDNKMVLSDLRLQKNQIQKIVSLPKCSSLYLSNNKLTNLNWIANCKTQQWTSCNFSTNLITDISGLFKKDNKFKSLYSLQLNENKIKKFQPGPNSCKFPSLGYMTIENNQIESVNDINFDVFPSTTFMNFAINKIKKFGPKVILKSLTSLYIGNNQGLQIIPGCELPLLTQLSMDHCKIKSLDWLNKFRWSNLIGIVANANQIKALPKIQTVFNIMNFDVTDNPIQNIDNFLQSQINGTSMFMQYSLNPDLPLQTKKAMVQKIKAFKTDSCTCTNPQLIQEVQQQQQQQQQKVINNQQPQLMQGQLQQGLDQQRLVEQEQLGS